MTRERSPNYPALPLERAVQGVKTLFKKEGRTQVAVDIAGKHLGYQSLSGNARSFLAALRHYGLVDLGQGGTLRVSPRGITLAMRAEDSPEYRTAIQEAALTPSIFKELYETKGEASDDNLAHYLVTQRKFSPDGARKLVRSFRGTLAFVNLGEPGYDGGGHEEIPEDDDVETMSQGRGVPPPPPLMKSLQPPVGSDQYQFRIGGTIATVILTGDPPTRHTLERLRRHIELTEEDLPSDTIERDPGATAETPE